MLFRQYYEMLCFYAVKFVKDPDEAEEIVQEFFYQLWLKKEKLDIRVSLKSYLYASVHNRCLKYLRHQTVADNYREYYREQETENVVLPDEMASLSELQAIINHTLDTLPAKCSKIFRLNRYEGLKYQEIASKLSISVKTVEASMGKTLKRLRKNLKDYMEVA